MDNVLKSTAAVLIALALTLAACASTDGPARARAQKFMVAAADPRAVEAGLVMLRQGGGAIDAAIAAQMVLNLVEPQSSGLGGGGFLLHWDQAAKKLTSYDGRETAPSGARADMFLGPDKKPLKFLDAVRSGRSVGVPGVLRMLEAAHRAHGKLPWRRLFAPAIALAEGGFAVSPRLHKMIARFPSLAKRAATRKYFFGADGAPRKIGERLKNPALAATFRRIAAHGADALYRGAIARDMARAVRRLKPRPGTLSRRDLAAYQAKERPPVCGGYRRYRVCGMGPPSSGGVTVLQILGLLRRFDLAALAPRGAQAAHLLAEAGRLAFADRGRYLADGDFVRVPVRGLLDRGYLRERAKLIQRDRAMGTARAGAPPSWRGALPPQGDGEGGPSTTHLSVVDAQGNAVSFTSSIEFAFGSRIMVRGFLLNNQLTDFSFRPTRHGKAVANRVAPGKRPRSSMSPTMVFDRDGRLLLVIGSPGGSRIIGYVAQTLVGVLDWGLDVQAAIDLPHVLNRNRRTELERGPGAAALAAKLKAMGHQIRIAGLTSGLHGIQVTRQGLIGGADRRREGLARGD